MKELVTLSPADLVGKLGEEPFDCAQGRPKTVEPY